MTILKSSLNIHIGWGTLHIFHIFWIIKCVILFFPFYKLNLPSIYKFGLSVCLYPINVKTAEPIGPKFFVGHHLAIVQGRFMNDKKI